MKVIFLDIDGVLNGIDYQQSATEEPPFIDTDRLPILKEIADESGAKIVLSSSWKKAWKAGCDFDCIFRQAGIVIYDTTPALGRKNEEISAWLASHSDVDGFVILDDADSGWGNLLPHLVNTDPIEERGLEQKHIAAALQILEKQIQVDTFAF